MAIRPGDAAALLVLAENPLREALNGRELLWPTSAWGPVGLPLFGTYDGRGSLIVDEDEGSAFTLAFLRERTGEGAALNLEQLASGRVNARTIVVDGQELPLARALLHRRMWTFLTEEFTFEVWDRSANCEVVVTGSAYLRSVFSRLAATASGIEQAIESYRSLGMSEEQAEMMASIMGGGQTVDVHAEIQGGDGEMMLGGYELFKADRPLFLAEYTKVLTLRTALMFLRRSFLPVSSIGEHETPARRYDGFLKACQDLVVDQKADEILREG